MRFVVLACGIVFGLLATEASALPFANTNKASYVAGENVVVTYNILFNETNDYVGISPINFAPGELTDFQYANSPPNRVTTFNTTGFAAGTYVIRTYHNNDIEIVAESVPFLISEPTATLTSDASTYNNGDAVTISYTGLVAGSADWIGIVPAGQPGSTYIAFASPNATNTAVFTGLPLGTFEAVGFENNTLVELARSAPFTISGTATLTTDKTAYAVGESITVTSTGLLAATQDWIGIIPLNEPANNYVAFVYASSGTDTFTNIPVGTYRARGFVNNSAVQAGQSAIFTVGNPPTAATVTALASVSMPQPITFSWSGGTGLATDWVSIAAVGSPLTNYISGNYINGAASGTGQFANPGSGQYVIRLYTNDSYTVIGQSVTITVP
jgi:hypothetical protein